MEEIQLNSNPGSKAESARLNKKSTKTDRSGNASAPEISFDQVLKNEMNAPSAPPEIRHDLVAKVKATLANNSYEVKAQELADKMIQKIRENKTRFII